MNGLITNVLNVVRGELESHRISLQTELRDGLPLIVAEPTQLQQVLLNLVMNAVDAMNLVADRERVLVVRTETDESDQVLITVEDSGTGIDPAHLNRIFEAFFTTKAQGMGMGLSICRSIIESHGGRLSVSARHPYGSIFRVALPITELGDDRDG